MALQKSLFPPLGTESLLPTCLISWGESILIYITSWPLVFQGGTIPGMQFLSERRKLKSPQMPIRHSLMQLLEIVQDFALFSSRTTVCGMISYLHICMLSSTIQSLNINLENSHASFVCPLHTRSPTGCCRGWADSFALESSWSGEKQCLHMESYS